MSGIVGIFERRETSVERPLLQALTDLMAGRGPDVRRIWSDGPVGFGHALLRTVRESAEEGQPASLDGRLFITADARLDRRNELIAEIESSKQPVVAARLRGVPAAFCDAELILCSYAVWGIDCIHHLRGDFAFAIWDSLRRTLFCARDHFGVKPFYYADLGEVFLFSNTLDCVRAHPGVSDELNDRAIAGFLLEGFNSDLETTSFRDIRRLPPAHFLVSSEAGIRTQRYWSPPIDGRIRYSRAADYVEHFQILFRDAVADRLRCDRAGVWMSGGMDSSAVAATARALFAAPGDLCAYTMVYESLIPDCERKPAQQVADFLKIPIRFLKMDDLPFFGGLDHPALATSEPMEDPFFAGVREQYRLVAGDCRVMLSGEGADSLMHFQMWPYVRDLSRRREWRRLLGELPAYLWERPFPWKGLRERAGRLFSANLSDVPDWVSPELAARLSLGKNPLRVDTSNLRASHPFMPMAHTFLSAPQWATIFELADPGATHSTVEIRHPFLDLRIVNYLLAIAPFPWAFQKGLLREAMKGKLPEGTLTRPKTPLGGDPLRATMGRLGTSYLDGLPWDAESDRYIDHSRLQSLLKMRGLEGDDLIIRALCLNIWLQSGRRIRYKLAAEVRNA